MTSRRPEAEAEALARRWVSLYGDVAVRTAYLFLHDRGLAEDCVQEALVKAWRKRNSLRDPGAERAWLLSVVANQARSQLRKRVPEPREGDPADPDPGDLESRAALALDLGHALDQLSPDQRQVVVMRIYLDLSVEETADALGIAPGTVKSRLSRALEELRSSWTQTID